MKDCFAVLHDSSSPVCQGCSDQPTCSETTGRTTTMWDNPLSPSVLVLSIEVPTEQVRDYSLAHALGYVKDNRPRHALPHKEVGVKTTRPTPPSYLIRAVGTYKFRPGSTGEYMLELLATGWYTKYQLRDLVREHFQLNKANGDMRTDETLVKMRGLGLLEEKSAQGHTGTDA